MEECYFSQNLERPREKTREARGVLGSRLPKLSDTCCTEMCISVTPQGFFPHTHLKWNIPHEDFCSMSPSLTLLYYNNNNNYFSKIGGQYSWGNSQNCSKMSIWLQSTVSLNSFLLSQRTEIESPIKMYFNNFLKH